jgi:nucleoside-diphosphate-sugar epimerase
MKIIITGTEGCVGSHLTEFLRGRQVEVVEFEGDITVWDDWMKYADTKWDMLINLAAIAGVRRSFEEPEFYYHNNVDGTDNALAFGDMACDKVLYASSSNAYEWWGNPYAATKMMCEVLGRRHKNAKGMRFHTVWPGRDDMLYKKLSKGEVEYINGNHSRDWIHINDLCRAILTVIENWSTIDETVLDFGTGNTFNVLEMAQKIFNWTGEIRRENPQGERIKTQANVQYLYDLGWKPEKDILDESCHTK